VCDEIRRLDQFGYIDVKPDPHDRRAIIITLAPEGIKFLNEVRPHCASVYDRLFANLDAAERRHFVTLLAKAVSY
jgi:DNA-binding MarR family transcriptional regulator